ncbi:MAG: ABC transporter permease, partial [Rhodobacteraceae bacterium]|nr:ABC transporter permease [Paracoccaceae bacterium]
MFWKKKKAEGVDQQAKEAYFTASQGQLIWARFKSNRTSMIALYALVLMIVMGLFAPFLSPYDPTIAGRDKDYENGAPQIPKFWDENGFSIRPFIYATERERSAATNFRWVMTEKRDHRLYVQFFVRDWDYRIFHADWDLPGNAFDVDVALIRSNLHLFGVEGGKVHLFGTDGSGKDIFGRTLHAIWTSLAVGTLGVFISFVLALVIGGVAGYFGGWIDSVLQMITDAIRTVPSIPLFMALAAFMPDHW